MPRSAEDIDSELRQAVARRWRARDDIRRLSKHVIADTKLIDLLLAQRSELVTTLT